MNNLGDKLKHAFDQYDTIDQTAMAGTIKEAKEKAAASQEEKKIENLMRFIDITTLSSTDTKEKVLHWCEQLNKLNQQYPSIPQPAGFCVFPNFLELISAELNNEYKRVAVVGCFPHAQTFIEVKVAEAALASASGAQECDMVISLSDILEEDYAAAFDEIAEVKSSIGDAKLKVILESGEFQQDPETLKKAAILACEAGADFLKTSTGKSSMGATYEACYIMSSVVRAFEEKGGRKVGIKVSGSITEPEDALVYQQLVSLMLGSAYNTPSLFRIGASSLANKIITQATGLEKDYF